MSSKVESFNKDIDEVDAIRGQNKEECRDININAVKT